MEAITRKAVIYGALAHASLLESARRKDLYVAGILAVLMIGAAATIGTFGVKGLELFLKDVALTVIGVLSTVLAVLFAARQIPEEVSHRTVYPLLARPISRADLIVGKFLGAWLLSLVGLLLFAAVAAGALAYYGLSLGAIFGQFLLLRAFALAIIVALTMALSLVMTPGATVTMSLLLAVGSATFSNAVKLLVPSSSSAQQVLLKGAYYVLPQLNLFDLTKKVSYGWQPVSTGAIGALAVYALLFTALFLSLGALRFRRQAL
ncbi:MAG TPA: ABC transporter permease subunit [Armatimonadaceae bacterium]|nr:ABC transporter permease subunit [Armatimonadaceae bacterium]